MDRRFVETGAWIKDLSGDQKRFFWLMLTSALASIGALAGIVVQLITKAG